MEKKDAALVLVSGGLDSTVLLHYCSRHYKKLYALAVSYGQRHERELTCARYQAEQVGASFTEADLNVFGQLLQGGSTLLQAGAEVPELSTIPEELRDQPSTYVPNRNMVLLSFAAAFAEARQVQDIYYGAQAQVEYGYWDCTENFVEKMNAVLALNRREPVQIHAPFMHDKKEDIVRRGLQLGVDFSQTWSCYTGGKQPCGTCPTCVERNAAFAALNMVDPLITSTETDKS